MLARPEFAQARRAAADRGVPRAGQRVDEHARRRPAGPALLFPEEFGGLGRGRRRDRRLRDARAVATSRCWSSAGSSSASSAAPCTTSAPARTTRRYLDRRSPRFELPGAFAMSESGHGSNVQNVQTTATYDPRPQEFVVDTPTEEDRKDYIGNAARDGRIAAVFCQLDRRRREARRPLRARPDPRRGRQRRRRHPDRGLRPQARAQRRRQRPHLVRRRARPAREPARPLRPGQRPRASTSARSRTRTAASSRCSAR